MARQAARRGDAKDAGYDIVHARMLEQFPELVAELGGELAEIALLAAAGSQRTEAPGQAVTYRGFVDLLETAARELACPDFGMRLAARQNGAGMFGPLGQVMRNSRNFGEALTYVSNHAYAHSLAARVWLRRIPGEPRLFAGHDILLDHAAGHQQAIEHILLAGHLSAMGLTGGWARARIVHFRHEPVSSRRTYRRYFGCEVRFGEAAEGLTFSDEDLAAPVIAPDERALEEITAIIEQRFTRRQAPFHAQVRGTILRLIGTGNCSTEQVASALCIHPRTLHRRLREEGTSFQKLKDEVRKDLLRYFLERTELGLARISEKLGFAEQSVMTRSCRRWFGAPPSELRRRLGGDRESR